MESSGKMQCHVVERALTVELGEQDLFILNICRWYNPVLKPEVN